MLLQLTDCDTRHSTNPTLIFTIMKFSTRTDEFCKDNRLNIKTNVRCLSNDHLYDAYLCTHPNERVNLLGSGILMKLRSSRVVCQGRKGPQMSALCESCLFDRSGSQCPKASLIFTPPRCSRITQLLPPQGHVVPTDKEPMQRSFCSFSSDLPECICETLCLSGRCAPKHKTSLTTFSFRISSTVLRVYPRETGAGVLRVNPHETGVDN